MRPGKKTSLALVLAVAVAVAVAAVGASSGSASPQDPQPPRNIDIPDITGLQVGQTLTANPGRWSGHTPMTFLYQWNRSNGSAWTPIAGATNQTYTITDADLGHNLFVQIKATNEDGPGWANTVPTEHVTGATVADVVTLPSGQSSVLVDHVVLPNRLMVASATFGPAKLTAGGTITATVKVLDSFQHPVRGALVQVVGLPFGALKDAAEVATGNDGTATIQITGTAMLAHMPGGAIAVSVRARKSGEDPLGGVTGTRIFRLGLGK